MLIEALIPLHIRRPGGDLHLLPGQPIELDAEEAQRLLTKARGKVQVVAKEKIVMEPALKPDCSPLSPIYWETGDGRILGPATPEFLARDGSTFWISTNLQGQIWWITADRLRSRRAFEGQVKLNLVELVREPQ